MKDENQIWTPGMWTETENGLYYIGIKVRNIYAFQQHVSRLTHFNYKRTFYTSASCGDAENAVQWIDTLWNIYFKMQQQIKLSLPSHNDILHFKIL